VIEAAMPVVTLSVVASSEYGADEAFGAQAAAISTLLSFLVIPLLMLFL
jgi:predicted permease